MDANVPPYEPPPIENARRQYVELFGSALVMNTYLKIALLCVSLVAVGLVALNFRTVQKYEHLKPLVIRIDDVGRAQAVQYDTLTYRPEGQAPELKYFLTQFVAKHFARMRATVQERYAESLYFLDAALADATIAQNDQSRVLEMFVTNPTADEIEVAVQNVSLSELSTTPFKAAVTFQKLYYSPGTRSERNRETYVAQVDFVLREHVPNEFVRVNPLGLQIEYFRVDQAFEEGRQ